MKKFLHPLMSNNFESKDFKPIINLLKSKDPILTQSKHVKNFEKSQGYVGRKVGPGVNPSQGYIQEPTADRSNYQFEPGVAMLKPDTTDVDDIITYPGFVDSIELEGGDVTKQIACGIMNFIVGIHLLTLINLVITANTIGYLPDLTV